MSIPQMSISTELSRLDDAVPRGGERERERDSRQRQSREMEIKQSKEKENKQAGLDVVHTL